MFTSDDFDLTPSASGMVKCADPALIAANLVVADVLACDPGLRRRAGQGAIIILHAPSDVWCASFAEAWRDAMSDELDLPRRALSRREPGRYDKVLTKPLGRSGRDDAEEVEAMQASVRVGLGAWAISHDPDRCIPASLLAAADHRIRPRSPDVGDLHLIAAQATGGSCPPLRRPAEPLSPAHLRFAVRQGQGPGDYVRRVLDLMAADRRVATGPGLDGLHGMAEAVAWGRTVARDLRAFAAGILPWSEVDRGALLAGPPGTGKTTFAKRLAAECGVPLIATSYSEWQSAGREGHAGELMKCLSARFAEARRLSPCILFIDELDSIPTRGATRRADDWWTMVVNGLLAEMDGPQPRDGVLILGAGNLVERVDPAIRRSGRLDRVIRIGLPDRAAMEAILLGYLDGALPAADVGSAARRAVGASGADAERWCRGARRRARTEGRAMVAADLLEEIGGRDERSPERRLRTAYHEAGHAIGILLRCPGALTGVSIRRNGMAGGGTEWTVAAMEGDTPESLAALLRDLLAGRAAEEVVYGAAGAGCGGPPSSDLARATLLAASAELAWGLGDALCWRGDPDGDTLPQLLAVHRGLADRVERRLRVALADARDMLLGHRQELDALASALTERETLSGEEAALVIAEARRTAPPAVHRSPRENTDRSIMTGNLP